MGTRGLTIVMLDGEYKVAQYGQWDHYPAGQGVDILRFLHHLQDDDRFHDFVSSVKSVNWIDDIELNQRWIKAGADIEPGHIGEFSVNLGVSDTMKKMYPWLHRDCGAKVLGYVLNEAWIELKNDIAFAGNSLFCEWAWVIDLDQRTFEAYKGFNREPLAPSDRFYEHQGYTASSGEVYHPVKLAASFSLDDLPSETEFQEAFHVEDGE